MRQSYGRYEDRRQDQYGNGLDAEIAERVMGEAMGQGFVCPSCGGSHFGTPDPFTMLTAACHDEYGHGCSWHGTRDVQCFPFPEYSSDIAAAWQVVERMQEYSCDFTLEKAGMAWYADFRVGAGSGDTPALAICLAALDAQTTQPPESAVAEADPQERIAGMDGKV